MKLLSIVSVELVNLLDQGFVGLWAYGMGSTIQVRSSSLYSHAPLFLKALLNLRRL